MEADDFLFTDMNIISQSKQLTPSAPPMPEDIESPFSYEEEAENKHPTAWEQVSCKTCKKFNQNDSSRLVFCLFSLLYYLIC